MTGRHSVAHVLYPRAHAPDPLPSRLASGHDPARPAPRALPSVPPADQETLARVRDGLLRL